MSFEDNRQYIEALERTGDIRKKTFRESRLS